METLYDLLGALPRDDADALRTAFRRAVKGAHPDLRPDDPDAAVKFRQIVRANEILTDTEQRAAYDHLLSLARLEKDRALAHPIAAKVHKVASGVMALSSASAVTVGSYLLVMHMSIALAPAGNTASSHPLESYNDLTARVSASIAALRPPVAPDPAALNAFIARTTAPPVDPMPPAVITVANLDPLPVENENLPEPVTVTLPQLSSNYASPFYAMRVSTLGHRNTGGDGADLDQAIEFSPRLLVSYADHGTPFYQIEKSDHVFADVKPAKRAEKPVHPRPHASVTATLPKVVPLPAPRMPAPPPEHIFSGQQPWYASANQ